MSVERLAPGEEGRRNRALGLAGAAAAVVALLAVLWMLFGGREPSRPVAPERPSVAPVSAPPPVQLPPQARVAYAGPDPTQVSAAYSDVGRVYRAGGASELARTSRACFERLSAEPTYGLLDYCLAFDAFSAAVMRRLSGQSDILPASSWFGQAPHRGLQVSQALMGPQGDGSARLLDIRRLALSTVRAGSSGVRAEAVPQVSAGPLPARTAVRPQPAAPSVVSPPAPTLDEPPRRAEPPRPPVVVAARPRPAERQRPAPRPVTTAPPREYAEAPRRPEPAATPSFSCRSARTRSERLVCGDPELARLDRELNRAYESAIASGVGRRALRREQDSWLAVRESAARDPEAVAEIYELRIDELREMSGDY